jgi:hypothetical protein
VNPTVSSSGANKKYFLFLYELVLFIWYFRMLSPHAEFFRVMFLAGKYKPGVISVLALLT